ncbi:MAG: hypothetical protein IPO43_18500 [Rhodoferax sp.]|nr:hypothetical protein [Rhodoferax sp.]
MPAPKPTADIIVLNTRTLALLLALRDALVQTSLSLHDLKFEIDLRARDSAQRDCAAMLERVRQRSRTDH